MGRFNASVANGDGRRITAAAASFVAPRDDISPPEDPAHFMLNQDVEVRISSTIWVAGIILGVLMNGNGDNSILSYKVAFATASGVNREAEFTVEAIRRPRSR